MLDVGNKENSAIAESGWMKDALSPKTAVPSGA